MIFVDAKILCSQFAVQLLAQVKPESAPRAQGPAPFAYVPKRKLCPSQTVEGAHSLLALLTNQSESC